jgi:demethylmenaquinone methyltransferase/2-methoxy-6-polyprenyl-1,4-benzoquinol methylase
MQRVLKKGGRLLILEFSTPRHFPVKQLYRLYFKHIMPMVGGWLSGNKAAYNYFFDSVYRFPQGEEFMSELLEAGFTRTTQRRMTFGIATAYYAAK